MNLDDGNPHLKVHTIYKRRPRPTIDKLRTPEDIYPLDSQDDGHQRSPSGTTLTKRPNNLQMKEYFHI